MSDVKGLDAAVDAYIKGKDDENGTFVTGWVLIASLSSPEHDSTRTDGYVTISSDGLPHHVQVGLMTVALEDKRTMSMLGAMGMISIDLDDEDDDE